MRLYVFLLTVLLQFQWQALSVKNYFESPANATCACPGEVLTYTCTVDGGNATIWGGAAFDCAENDTEIILYHREFSNGTSGECNNGAIVGRSVDVVNGTYYISQLNVTVSSELNNKTVYCTSYSMMYNNTIGESLIKVAFYSAPGNIKLADAQEEKLLFSWTPVASKCSHCSDPNYYITFDCGTCPNVTNMTTATCYDLQLTTNANMCHFSISSYSVMCDRAGDPSSPVAVTLKVPNVPKIEKLVLIYLNDSQTLKMMYIMTVNQTEDFFTVSGNISGSPTSFSAHAFNLVTGTSFNSTVKLSSCEEGSGCPIELPDSSYCLQSTNISVNISAVNILGKGPYSKPFMIECTNKFAQVEYNETTSELIISCGFQNPSDTSGKTCCVIYHLCDQEGTENVHECNNTLPYRIELEVSDNSRRTYCYTVTASDGTYIFKVDGNFTTVTGFKQWENSHYVIVIIIVTLAVVFIIVCIALCILVKIITRKRRSRKQEEGYQPLIDTDTLKLYLTAYCLPSTLILHKVPSDCKLREYVTKTLNVKHGFRRGHTYYEFTNEVENILEGKEVLLQDKQKKKEWFRLAPPKEIDDGLIQLYGEGIAHSNFGDRYRVFIQSFGPGDRYLPGGSCILYNRGDDQVEPDILQLVPVCSEHFAHKVIEEECEVQQFCTKNRLNPKAFNIFLTEEHLPKRIRHQQPRDVILMNRVSRKLFTGPFARQMFDQKNEDKPDEWKAFVLLEQKKQGLVLKKDSEVLYQDSRYMNGRYTLLEVDEDCVRMSKFIETKHDCEFEDRKVFYEAEKEEDLLYYKKILRPKKEELKYQQLELQSLVEYFYAIDGVPSNKVKLKDLQHRRIFIQSTSQGSRCLKKGAKLLYLEEYISSNNLNQRTDPDEASHTDAESMK